MFYFSAYPYCAVQCLPTERTSYMWLPFCREAWGMRTQWALRGPYYFPDSLYDAAGISKDKCLKEIQNVYVPINDTQNGRSTPVAECLNNYYIKVWHCEIIFQRKLVIRCHFYTHILIALLYVLL